MIMLATIASLAVTAVSAQTVMTDSTTKAHIIIWDRNTETDVEYYNIYLIQPITEADTSADSTRWIYTRIGNATHPPANQDSVSFQVNQVQNSSRVFAFTVTAVDHAGNQSGYGKNRDDPSLRRSHWIYALPPNAPTGIRVVTIRLPGSMLLMIMQGKVIDMEVLQNTIIKVKE